jgi:glycogen debranching enzyme
MSPVASLSDSSEWLEADGLGGFASGTTTGIRTRRYHALLLTATAPPAGRTVLVNGMDVWLNTMRGSFALSSQRYVPEVVYPDGVNRLKEFRLRSPWPCWRFNLWEDFFVEHELFVPRGQSAVILTWRVLGDRGQQLSCWLGYFFPGEPFTRLIMKMHLYASLWYIIAVEEFLHAANGDAVLASEDTVRKLEHAVEEILKGYSRGTRFGIHADTDGLLAAGVPGLQLTWMDAKVYDHVVTPRIGKPVEVQALWLNALAIGQRISNRWQSVFATAWDSFQARFWNENRGQLYDIVDFDHRPGAVDQSIRPNQIFAVGGLPLVLLPGDRARRVVDAVETGLYTPLGLRSLAPGENGYMPHYEGNVWHRDMAYHQGTAWPWLIGPFVEAWVRVRGNTADAKKQARQQFFEPFVNHLSEAGLGHVSEIVDAELPHTPRGCPFQAWSLGELLRLDQLVLAEV